MSGLLSMFRRAKPEGTPVEVIKADTAPTARRRGAVGRMALRLFNAANFDHTTEDWVATPTPADDIIRTKQRVLVARSREQAANNDYVANFLRMVGQNVVGHKGILLQAQARTSSGQLDTATNEAHEWAWWDWGKAENCDIAGRKSWRQIQRLCAITAAKDGEFLVRMVRGPLAGPWGFALQVIDPQRLPVDFDSDRVHGLPGHFIRHGIEFNRYGRAMAYHLTATDEEESSYRVGGRNYVRVPAAEIIHGFKEEITGQKRGLPWTSTPMDRLKHVNGFEKAAVMNARAGAAKMGFFTWKDGQGPEPEEGENGEAQPIEIDAEPLSFHELPSGVDFKEFNPAYPSGEFAGFTKRQLQGAAAGFGVPYPTLAADLEGVSFSSIRNGELDVRERWKDDQEWLIETLVDRVHAAWLEVALLSGRIQVNGKPVKASRIEELRIVEWQGRRWAWVDPTKDTASAIESIQSMLTSPSAVMRELGRDPATVYKEIAADYALAKSSGIPEHLIQAAWANAVAKPRSSNEDAQADSE